MIKDLMHDPIFLAGKSEVATKEDLQVAQDLLDTLTAHKDECVGMAANMIGVRKRIIVFDNEGSYMTMFNPEIIKKSGPYDAEEGCLSLPGLCGTVSRPQTVQVKAQNREGKWCLYKGEDLKARCFCHEIDHLDGILYKDRLLEGTMLQRVSELEEVE
jgi:peptide deformylase